jgi:hypothetical protein
MCCNLIANDNDSQLGDGVIWRALYEAALCWSAMNELC